MRDFTLRTYKGLLRTITNAGYCFQTLEKFVQQPAAKVVVLWHDSDIWPKNDLKMAQTENSMNISNTIKNLNGWITATW